MARINCKCCGCPNDTIEGKFVVVCEACGTEQAIPNLDSEKKTNLFNRANAARLKNDFDKALQNYEAILVDYPNDAEAHWGIVLCRYGIEYVDDPRTKKKIPTCHRTLYNSIFDDVDYKDAIANADVIARKIYQDEAEVIDKIQKSIIAISQKEAPYDIFICYKESDENGARTRDSFVAEDIYTELTNKNYKVFFSRITLESKLGQQYEPIIFAALQSAKVMLVIASKKEYFEAVWVKNEWTRYLSFMAENKGSKYMIPCYRDMEAYDMPDEFLALQSQNLDRLGAKQDLIRAIDKVFGKDKAVPTTQKADNLERNHNFAQLKRALLFIEDEEYSKADECLEKVLDSDPECAEAYTYKILIAKKLHKPADLADLPSPLDDDKNYQKALRFASDDYKVTLEGYNNKIIANLNEKNKKNIYASAISAKNKGNFEEAITLFNKVIDYQDSKTQVSQCENKIKDEIYANALTLKTQKKYDEAITLFNKVIYYKDSQQQIQQCKDLKINGAKEENYVKNTALAISASSHDTYDANKFKQAIYSLKTILDYKDVSEFINKYEKIFVEMGKKLDEEAEVKRIEEERIAEEKKIEAERIQAEKEKQAKIRKDKTIRFFKIFTPIAIIVIALIVLTFTLFIPMGRYNKAIELINAGKYDEAQSILENINYSDSKQQLKMIHAEESFSTGDYETAIDIIYNAGGTVEIAYDSDGGNSTKDNETIKKLSYVTNESSKDGYTFYGWVLASYELDFRGYTANITLKASYTPIKYSITYDLDGGKESGSNPNQYIRTDSINISDPIKTGYTFIGWTGTNLDTPTKNLTLNDTFGNKEYKANWQANNYTITYDVNGGTVLDNNVQSVTYDSEYKLAMPTRVGYDFSGWYNDDNLVNGGIWKETSNVTLKAKWTIKEYNISYNLNGGTNSSDNPVKYTFEDETITLANPTKVGYTFLGWTTSDITTPTFNLTIEKNSTQDKEFTAQWQANDYTILFDKNGGNTDILSQTYTFDAIYTLPTPERTGYTFVQWNYGNEKVDSPIWSIAENCTLVAQWQPKENTPYTVRHYLENANDDGYTLSTMENLTGTSGATITPTVNTYNGFNSPSQQEVSILPDGSLVVDYYYTRKICTITFITNGGNNIESVSQKYETSIDSSIVATRSGYTFGGWFTDVNLYKQYTFDKLGLEDITLYAFWKEENKPSDFLYEKYYNSIIIHSTQTTTETVLVIPNYIGGIPISSLGRTFSGCSSLTSITIPNSVKSIGGSAFYECSSLKNVYYDGTIEDWCNIAFNTDISFSGDYANPYSRDYANPMIYASHFYLRNNNNEWKEVTSIEIPNTVTKIGKYQFCGFNNVTYIVVPNSVTSIGSSAFYNCNSLESITIPFVGSKLNGTTNTHFGYIFGASTYNDHTEYIPSSLKKVIITGGESLGSFAFDRCSSLTSIEIPKSVTSIGSSAFGLPGSLGMCESLTNVYYEGTIEDWCNISFGHESNPMYYANHFYLRNSNNEWEEVTSIEIPDIVTKIGNGQFYGFDNVTSITIPSTIISIGDSAFSGCYGLTSIEIPESVTSIGKGAFMGCGLTSIVIPNSVTSIGESAFYNCSSLESITLPFVGASLNETENTYFNYIFGSDRYIPEVPSSLKEVIINGGKSIGENVFANCSSLESITLPDSVTSIGNYAFYGCSNLMSVIGGNGVTSIGKNAFYNCTKLNQLNSKVEGIVNIPVNVTNIGDYTFFGCAAIEEYTMGDVIEIGDYAFSSNTSLIKFNSSIAYEMKIPNICTSIGIGAFSGCSSIKSIILPYIGASLNDTSNKNFGYIFGASSYSENLKNVPSSLTKVIVTGENNIGEYAFYDCSSLTSIEIPTSVTSIGNYAFYNCSKLKQLNSEIVDIVNLPESVTNIGEYTFYGCTAIEEYTMGNITEIDAYAFYSNTSLIKFNSSTTYEMKIPSTCTNVGEYAFGKCNLIKKFIWDKTEFVTISSNMLCSMGSLTNLILPSPLINSPLGVLFGTTSYSGSLSTSQNETTYYIPSTLREVCFVSGNSIPDYFFANCKNIEKITGLSNVYQIGQYAFYNCTSLSSINSDEIGVVNISTNLRNIPDYAFYNCSSLLDIKIGNIENVGQYAFFGCSNIKKFNSNNDFELVIPNSCEIIGDYAFSGLKLIKTVEISNNVISLGNYSFEKMSALTTFSTPFIPNTSTLGRFFGTSSYTGSTSTIQNGTYYYIPTTLKIVNVTRQTKIPDYAFYNCKNLTQINLLSNAILETNSIINCSATVNYNLSYDNSYAWDGITISETLSGLGTKEDPYVITKPTELVYFINQVNLGNDYASKFIKLSSNINLNYQEINVIGNATNTFKGTFNGNGYSIKNFKINSNTNCAALFGFNEGVISNLGIYPNSIKLTSNDAKVYLGSLVGYNKGTISNCFAQSSTSISYSSENECYVGGLVGYNDGTINSSYSSISVSATNTNGYAMAGGLVGYNNGTIANSFATGNVLAKGLANSYSKNGGLIGDESQDSIITDCYYSLKAILTRYTSSGSYNTTGTALALSEIISNLIIIWDSTFWELNYNFPILKS